MTKYLCKQVMERDSQQKQLPIGFDLRGLHMLGLLDIEDILLTNIIFKEVKDEIKIARKERRSIMTKQIWEKMEGNFWR